MKQGVKLISLLAVAAITGCSSPVKSSEINQSIWDGFFKDYYTSFLAQNVTIEMTGDEANATFEINANQIHFDWKDGNEEYYTINFIDDTTCSYECVYKKNGRWVKESDKDSFENFFLENFSCFDGFNFYKMEDFELIDNVYTYKGEELEVSYYSWGTVYQSNIKIAFADEKISSLSYTYRQDPDDALMNVSFKFSKYGKTSFTIPEAVETPLFTLNVEEGLNVTPTAYGPLKVADGNIWNEEKAPLTDMSYDHNMLYGSQQLEELKSAKGEGYYRAFVFGLTVDEDTKLDLDKSLTTAYPAMIEGGLNTARSLRIGFIMESGSFVYAPLQVKEKCSYSNGQESGATPYNEGEIYDMNSQGKVSLPANQEIYVVTWFDGWDENCVNEASFQEVFITLGFSK